MQVCVFHTLASEPLAFQSHTLASETLAFRSNLFALNRMIQSKLKTKYGWRSRGYLPHFDGGEISQFITTRLCDSLPQNILEKWRIELEDEEITDIEFRKKIEFYLDQGCGKCYLKDSRIAQIIRENLLYHQDKKYKLYAWVIMPNHLHYLITPISPHTLAEITHSNKSYTAHRSNKILNRSGQFWFHESFDRYIRDENHFLQTIAYIENNPVKVGLCDKASDWEFSSAFKTGKVTGTPQLTGTQQVTGTQAARLQDCESNLTKRD